MGVAGRLDGAAAWQERRIRELAEADPGRDLSLSGASIALETGFSDQSHFTRVFSAHVGLSPGVWRRLRRS